MLPRIIYEFLKNKHYKKTTVSCRGRKLRVEIADTLAKGAIGLMYRDGLHGIDGMLFVFPFEHRWKIWMLNMRFSLDVIWIDKGKRVVGVERNLQPCKDMFSCRSYCPERGAKYAIELSAGTAKRLGIKLNDRAAFG